MINSLIDLCAKKRNKIIFLKMRENSKVIVPLLQKCLLFDAVRHPLRCTHVAGHVGRQTIQYTALISNFEQSGSVTMIQENVCDFLIQLRSHNSLDILQLKLIKAFTIQTSVKPN